MSSRRQLLALCLLAFAPAVSAPAQDQPQRIIWHDPGDVANLDFVTGPLGPEGMPKAPFTFIKEDMNGTAPKVLVRDSNGTQWLVKFGVEAKGSAFCSKILWATGYFINPAYMVQSGSIAGEYTLKRARDFVSADGQFKDGRFEIRTPAIKYIEDGAWQWDDNPFIGTKELSGLKILIMLFSNWDDKDSRDEHRGPNTSTFKEVVDGHPVIAYSMDDWGRTLGKWGHPLAHTQWDCKGYMAQTPEFVKGVDHGLVQFSYVGTREDVKKGIRVEDVQWLMKYLGRITDKQITAALQAVDTKPEDMDCFANHIRARIEELRKIASGN